jgi:hypothetical protein
LFKAGKTIDLAFFDLPYNDENGEQVLTAPNVKTLFSALYNLMSPNGVVYVFVSWSQVCRSLLFA